MAPKQEGPTQLKARTDEHPIVKIAAEADRDILITWARTNADVDALMSKAREEAEARECGAAATMAGRLIGDKTEKGKSMRDFLSKLLNADGQIDSYGPPPKGRYDLECAKLVITQETISSSYAKVNTSKLTGMGQKVAELIESYELQGAAKAAGTETAPSADADILEVREEELRTNGYEHLGRFFGSVPDHTDIRDNGDGTFSHTWSQLQDGPHERFSDIQAVQAHVKGKIFDNYIEVYAKRLLVDGTRDIPQIVLKQIKRANKLKEQQALEREAPKTASAISVEEGKPD
jgi:hypothetical protein